MQNILELQDNYTESVVRELIEKTQSGAVTWTHLGGTQFRHTKTQASPCETPLSPEISWDFFLTKTQIGTVSYRYNLDVKRDGVTIVSVTDGPLTHTNRDSVTKELYEVVEIIVLELDKKVKDALCFINKLPGAND